MKRVIDGVEYEAVETTNDACGGCIGNEIGSLSLCQQLRKGCHYKIWIKVDDEETQNKACNMNQTDKTLKAHKHVEAMKLYAEDAATTDKPWELWEFSHKEESHWYPLSNHPKWDSNYNYRRKAVKPKTININGYEVPEPLQNAPEGGTMYWYPNTSDTHVSCSYYYSQYQYNIDRLVNGLVHLTKEAAQKHLDALLSFTRKK